MLLDALTYVIDADNKKLNTELKSSEKKVDDLGNSMSKTEIRAKSLTDSAVAGFKSIGAALLAAVAVSKIFSSVTAYAETTENVRVLAETLGFAVEDLDAFGKTVQALGGTASGAQQSMAALTEKIGGGLKDATSGEAKMFRELGISLKDTSGHAKSTMKVLGEMSDKLAGMSRQEATFRLKQMGISDPKTIEAMIKGRKELDRLMREQKESGVITKEAAEQAQKYTIAQSKFAQETGRVGDAIGAALLPMLTKIVSGLGGLFEWINKHGDFVKGFFIAIGTVLALVYGPAVIAAAASTLILIAPFIAVAAAIGLAAGAFALIYDDIVNFMEGNDSLIGQIASVYPAIGELFKALYNVISGVFSLLTGDFDAATKSFGAAGESLKAVVSAVSSAIVGMFSAMSESVKSIFGSLKEDFEAVAQAFGAACESLKAVVNSVSNAIVGAFSSMSESVKSIFGSLTGYVSGVWNWIKGIYDKVVGMAGGIAGSVGKFFGGGAPVMLKANSQMASASANPLNSTTSNAISNSTKSASETNVSVGEVKVQTQATDAAGISKDIGSELGSQLKNLQTESASGVAR